MNLPKPEPRGPKPRKRISVRSVPRRASQKVLPRRKRPRRQRKTPLAKLKRELWTLFAAYVKERDGKDCISCAAKDLEGQNHHAGHFFNAGNHSVIKFHPKNCHSQCGRCNVWLRGNIANYAISFLDRYGVDEFRRLKVKSQEHRGPWTRPEVEAMISALEQGGVAFESYYFERYGA